MLLALVISSGACGGGSEDRPNSPSESSKTPSSHEATDPPEDQEASQRLRIWLTGGEALRPVVRDVPETEAVARAAIEELLAGPSDEETDLDIGSEIPPGTELLDVSISENVATVDLSGEFESGGGTATMRMRLAQLVYTLTEFDSVDGVELRIDGEKKGAFSSEGLDVSKPQSRRAYKDLLPPIVVLSPAIGDEVASPLVIEGTANVFEATVEFRLIVGDEEVASGFTTATCGSGCRGTYEGSLEFEQGPTEAILEVFETSAEDGSPLHVVRVPVVLGGS